MIVIRRIEFYRQSSMKKEMAEIKKEGNIIGPPT
jgi:hypothetical protein